MCGARNFLRLTETIFDYMFEWRIEDFVSATLVIFDEKCSSVNKLLKLKGENLVRVVVSCIVVGICAALKSRH